MRRTLSGLEDQTYTLLTFGPRVYHAAGERDLILVARFGEPRAREREGDLTWRIGCTVLI